jgi:hypothetical protein
MSTKDADRDAELLWEIECLRREGYEVCLVAFFNRQGHPRLITTLDTNEDVLVFLSNLLRELEEDRNLVEPNSAN